MSDIIDAMARNGVSREEYIAALESRLMQLESVASPKQSTPHECLIGQIMDSNIPKNEREWACAREIGRLRHEVKIREQICADATLYARRLQEADDEIERLRELLRETHLALSFMPDPTRKLLDLRYRVREALGE